MPSVIPRAAKAGTGKTATLQMIASARPDQKILYLVFNRKAREEGAIKFPGNVQVRTVHSLALVENGARWKDCGKGDGHKYINNRLS